MQLNHDQIRQIWREIRGGEIPRNIPPGIAIQMLSQGYPFRTAFEIGRVTDPGRHLVLERVESTTPPSPSPSDLVVVDAVDAAA